MDTIKSVNPATGEEIYSFTAHTDLQVKKIIDSASRAFSSWKVLPHADRAAMLGSAATLLQVRKSELAPADHP